MFRLVHLSDLRLKGTDGIAQADLEQWGKDLVTALGCPSRRGEPFIFDHVIISGNITAAGEPEGNAAAWRLVAGLCSGLLGGASSPGEQVFFAPNTAECGNAGFSALLEDAFPARNIVWQRERRCWIQMASNAVIFGAANPAPDFFVSELVEHKEFISRRPVILVASSGKPAEMAEWEKVVDGMRQFNSDIWLLTSNGWMLRRKDGWTVSISRPAATKEAIWPLRATVLCIGCHFQSGLHSAAYLKPGRGEAWQREEPPRFDSIRPSPVGMDSLGETYRPFVERLLQCIRGRSGSKLAVISGFPGVGKKYFFSYLVSRGANKGTELRGWQPGRTVKCSSIDVESEEDYADFTGKKRIGRAVKDRFDEVCEGFHEDQKTDRLLVVYDHLRWTLGSFTTGRNSDQAEGPVTPRVKLKFDFMNALCEELVRREVPNLHVVYFSANIQLRLDEFTPASQSTVEVVELKLGGEREGLMAMHAMYAHELPIRLLDLQASTGGYLKYSDKLMLEARSRYTREAGIVRPGISRALLDAARGQSRWLCDEARWFREILKWFLRSDDKLLEAIKTATANWMANPSKRDAAPILSLEPDPGRQALLEKLREYGVVSGVFGGIQFLPVLLAAEAEQV